MDANVHLLLDNGGLTLAKFEGRFDEIAIESAQLALKGGLTTVFDSWGPREYLVKARAAIDAGRAVGSRVFLAGNIIGLGGPFSEDFDLDYPRMRQVMTGEFADRMNALWQENVGPELTMMSPEQVRREIRAYAGRGVDFLKYAVTAHGLRAEQYILFSPRVQKIIVEEGHRAGITVQTHTTSNEGLNLAVEAGVDMLQHCDVVYGKEPISPENAALIAQRRVPCAILAYPDVALRWYSESAKRKPELAAAFEFRESTDRNQRALLNAGTIILLSTDAGTISATSMNEGWKEFSPPEGDIVHLGEGHFNWLLAVEQKGMKPMDALQAATRNIARAYKVDKELGTLEKGKKADLLVLARNPLQSAANYRSIEVVVKDGKIVDRAALPSQRLLSFESAKH
jgi:imidazolonepropionase-like amidohydrolase